MKRELNWSIERNKYICLGGNYRRCVILSKFRWFSKGDNIYVCYIIRDYIWEVY